MSITIREINERNHHQSYEISRKFDLFIKGDLFAFFARHLSNEMNILDAILLQFSMIKKVKSSLSLFSIKKWILAARLRTLPLSLSGLLLAGFIAKSEGIFRNDIFFLSYL